MEDFTHNAETEIGFVIPFRVLALNVEPSPNTQWIFDAFSYSDYLTFVDVFFFVSSLPVSPMS